MNAIIATKKKSMARFTCKVCGNVELVIGGTKNFFCVSCKPAGHYTLTAQYQAHLAVAKARKDGTLASPSSKICADCGSQASQYDHRDYSKPLDVVPVCKRCNSRRGPAIGSPAKKATHAASPSPSAPAPTR